MSDRDGGSGTVSLKGGDHAVLESPADVRLDDVGGDDQVLVLGDLHPTQRAAVIEFIAASETPLDGKAVAPDPGSRDDQPRLEVCVRFSIEFLASIARAELGEPHADEPVGADTMDTTGDTWPRGDHSASDTRAPSADEGAGLTQAAELPPLARTAVYRGRSLEWLLRHLDEYYAYRARSLGLEAPQGRLWRSSSAVAAADGHGRSDVAVSVFEFLAGKYGIAARLRPVCEQFVGAVRHFWAESMDVALFRLFLIDSPSSAAGKSLASARSSVWPVNQPLDLLDERQFLLWRGVMQPYLMSPQRPDSPTDRAGRMRGLLRANEVPAIVQRCLRRSAEDSLWGAGNRTGIVRGALNRARMSYRRWWALQRVVSGSQSASADGPGTEHGIPLAEAALNPYERCSHYLGRCDSTPTSELQERDATLAAQGRCFAVSAGEVLALLLVNFTAERLHMPPVRGPPAPGPEVAPEAPETARDPADALGARDEVRGVLSQVSRERSCSPIDDAAFDCEVRLFEERLNRMMENMRGRALS